MVNVKMLCALAAGSLLAACASIPRPERTNPPATAGAIPGATAPATSTGMFDRLQASWVRTAREGLSLRSGRAIGVATLRDMDAACGRGMVVEIVTTPSAAQAALAQTQCIAVWRSMAPDIVNSPQVLVVDGLSLVVEGQLRHASPRPIRQELAALAYLKASGQAQQMR